MLDELAKNGSAVHGSPIPETAARLETVVGVLTSYTIMPLGAL